MGLGLASHENAATIILIGDNSYDCLLYTYTFGGRTYRFPITNAKEHHYHHGSLKSQPFAVSKAWETGEEVLVECRYYSNAGNDAIFRDFPHAFKLSLIHICRTAPIGVRWRVSAAGNVREPRC